MAKDPKKKAVGDYGVGYAKPPKHSQFKPGQSGNPKGGKKPVLGIDELVDAELDKQTAVKVGGEVVKLAKRQALAKRIVADALAGDRHAQRLALALSAEAWARRQVGAAEGLSDSDFEQLMALVKEQHG